MDDIPLPGGSGQYKIPEDAWNEAAVPPTAAAAAAPAPIQTSGAAVAETAGAEGVEGTEGEERGVAAASPTSSRGSRSPSPRDSTGKKKKKKKKSKRSSSPSSESSSASPSASPSRSASKHRKSKTRSPTSSSSSSAEAPESPPAKAAAEPAPPAASPGIAVAAAAPVVSSPVGAAGALPTAPTGLGSGGGIAMTAAATAPPSAADQSAANALAEMPLADRLVHKVWKTRREAYAQLTEIVSELRDEDIAKTEHARNVMLEYTPLLKRIVADSNSAALDAGIVCLEAYLTTAGVVPGPNLTELAEELLPNLIFKGFCSARSNTVALAQAQVVRFMQLGAAEQATSALLAQLSNRKPKIPPACANCLLDATKDLGPAVVPMQLILRDLHSMFESANKTVRDCALSLTVELYRYVGKGPLNAVLSQLRSAQQAEFERLTADIAPASAVPPPAPAVAPSASDQDGGEAAAAAAAAAPAAAMLLPVTDLSSTLGRAVLEKLGQTEGKNAWKARRDGIERVRAACENSGYRVEGNRYTLDLAKALRRRLSDSQSNLKPMAAAALADLIQSVDEVPAAKLIRVVGEQLCAGAAENKKSMRDATLQALGRCVERNGEVNTVAMEALVVHLRTAFAATVGRAELLDWFLQRIPALTAPQAETAPALVGAMQDRTAAARTAAESCLAALLQAGLLSASDIQVATRDLAPAAKRQLIPAIDRMLAASGGPINSSAAAAAAAASSSAAASTGGSAGATSPTRGGGAATATGTCAAATGADDAPTAGGGAAARAGRARSRGKTRPRVGGPGTASGNHRRHGPPGGEARTGVSAARLAAEEVEDGPAPLEETEEFQQAHGAADNSRAAFPLLPMPLSSKDRRRAQFGRRIYWPTPPEEPDGEHERALCDTWQSHLTPEAVEQLFPKSTGHMERAVPGMELLLGLLRNPDVSFSLIVSHLDLMLRWITLRLCEKESNNGLQLLHEIITEIFTLLEKHEYEMLEFECTTLLPFLAEKSGHPRERFRRQYRDLFVAARAVAPQAAVVSALMGGFTSKNNRTRAECIQEIYRLLLLPQNTVSMIGRRGLREVIAAVDARDTEVRNNALELTYEIVCMLDGGMAKLLQIVGNVSEKVKTMIEERAHQKERENAAAAEAVPEPGTEKPPHHPAAGAAAGEERGRLLERENSSRATNAGGDESRSRSAERRSGHHRHHRHHQHHHHHRGEGEGSPTRDTEMAEDEPDAAPGSDRKARSRSGREGVRTGTATLVTKSPGSPPVGDTRPRSVEALAASHDAEMDAAIQQLPDVFARMNDKLLAVMRIPLPLQGQEPEYIEAKESLKLLHAIVSGSSPAIDADASARDAALEHAHAVMYLLIRTLNFSLVSGESNEHNVPGIDVSLTSVTLANMFALVKLPGVPNALAEQVITATESLVVQSDGQIPDTLLLNSTLAQVFRAGMIHMVDSRLSIPGPYSDKAEKIVRALNMLMLKLASSTRTDVGLMALLPLLLECVPEARQERAARTSADGAAAAVQEEIPEQATRVCERLFNRILAKEVGDAETTLVSRAGSPPQPFAQANTRALLRALAAFFAGHPPVRPADDTPFAAAKGLLFHLLGAMGATALYRELSDIGLPRDSAIFRLSVKLEEASRAAAAAPSLDTASDEDGLSEEADANAKEIVYRSSSSASSSSSDRSPLEDVQESNVAERRASPTKASGASSTSTDVQSLFQRLKRLQGAQA